MRIFILEDSSTRISFFKNKFCEHKLSITCSANSAIEYIKTNVYDVLFFDNDLGLGNGNGINVVTYLNETPHNKNNDALLIIHSLNIIAATTMSNILPQARIMSYGSVDFLNLCYEVCC